MLHSTKTIVLAAVFSLLNINLVNAQDIILDTTTNSSITQGNINGVPSDIIEGNSINGTNLFHSFSEFNVNDGRGAYFVNPAGINNILTRVTGVIFLIFNIISSNFYMSYSVREFVKNENY